MVRVLLDATAVPPDLGGVGRYVDSLVAALADRPADVELTVASQAADVPRFEALGVRVVAAPAAIARRPVRLAWEQSGLPLLARRARAEVVHSPHYTAPLLAPGRSVVTVHDATFFSDPDLHQPLKARFFRAATRRAVRHARQLIVPSAATCDELARFTAVDRGRVTVAPHGVDFSLFGPPAAAAVAALRAELGVDRYVAFLGTIEPRKNVGNLIRGWVEAMRGRSEPPALVLAGGRGWDDSVDAAMAAVPAELTVVRPGYVPLDQLSALLGGAELVVYPSLGEGFGLPVLEAMACGVAVLTTRRLSLPEVGGTAVAYAGTSADEIATAIAALLSDDARRAELGRAARERAAQFTWAHCADLHVQAYRRAVAA